MVDEPNELGPEGLAIPTPRTSPTSRLLICLVFDDGLAVAGLVDVSLLEI
jgi:hypothetical protein